MANFKETTLEDNESEAIVILNIKTGRAWNIGINVLGIIITLLGTQWLMINKKQH